MQSAWDREIGSCPRTHPPQRDLVLGWESAYTAQHGSGPPWNGLELVVFPRHLLSNVLSGQAMLTLRLQVPPCNKRLCVLQRWPRRGGGLAKEVGERETNPLLYSELACPGASYPQSTCHFWPLKGLKASWSQKQAGVPPCQIRRA